MTSPYILKERPQLETPLLLFDCELYNAVTEHWSTHRVTVGGVVYEPRIIRHDVFDIKAVSEDGFDGVSKLSVCLSNVDSHFSQIERSTGLKGAKLTVRFTFYDVGTDAAACDPITLFRGVANSPDNVTEKELRITFSNRLSLQRSLLPDVRIQRRCPWLFPRDATQRAEATTGGADGKYGYFYRCGYSADQPDGVGNLNNGSAFTSCDYSRTQCEQRGMFSSDLLGRPTARFGGIEFLPPSIHVRGFGEKGSHVAASVESASKYNDVLPIVYGTAWYHPPVVFARNDGNLTRLEVLLGSGEIDKVVTVLANDVEIPEGVAGRNMTGTGWYNVVTTGTRTGGFNLDFTNAAGQPLGDPYGSMAYLSLVLPNRLSDGKSVPRVRVLLRGLKLPQYGLDGSPLPESYSNNPAWVLLDVVRRSGWRTHEIDLVSFAETAGFCAAPVTTTDSNGTSVEVPRYQCNFALTKRRSSADVVRGIRNAALLGLGFGREGKLRIWPETTLALQHPQKPEGSNSTQMVNGGWPAYEFGDGTAGSGGVLRGKSGEPSFRIWSRSNAETVNRVSTEFQDQFNQYQQDSLSLVDVDDVMRSGQEMAVSYPGLGFPGFSQAGRVLRTYLDKSTQGNVFVEFETTVKGIALRPGDIIAISYVKEAFMRQPFRVVRLAPGLNYSTVRVTAQIHDDSWYETDPGLVRPGRRQGESAVGIPRPLSGSFQIVESSVEEADGSGSALLTLSFAAPASPSSNLTGVPLVGFAPQVSTEGGSLPGGSTYYYAVSALDSEGREGRLSFVTRATVPGLTNTNRVVLTDLSFPTGSTGFCVYRGLTPQQLSRIGGNFELSSTFVDAGEQETFTPPPDANYHHVNFYWRLEARPEQSVNLFSTDSIGHSALQMVPNEHRGMTVRITDGVGSGQEAVVLSNTGTTLAIAGVWTVQPDSSSRFAVSEAAWHFAAATPSSPVQFEVPNRTGATVQIVGRPSNLYNEECPIELCEVARWQVGGAPGQLSDVDVPGAPTFGLATDGQGNLEVVGVGFQNLQNTRSLQAGTLIVGYWSELNGSPSTTLAASLQPEDSIVSLSGPAVGQVGAWIQIDSEVLIITEVNGSSYRVTRAAHGTGASGHDAGALVYHLDRRTVVLPFSRDFFGSPASGNYAAVVHLPNARVAVAELFVTNARGNSEITRYNYTSLVDQGLRTLRGGQYSIQIEGYLAVQASAAPPLAVDQTTSVRDLFALVKEAPTAGEILVVVRQDAQQLATLRIPAGETSSNVVDGAQLAPLHALSELTIDITSVGDVAGGNPGRDLTVVIRV
ncbi:MAG: phage tail protein [Bryobacteraceae bacterium]|nr:phage tail protein [Bryobacteraceae bacterium]